MEGKPKIVYLEFRVLGISKKAFWKNFLKKLHLWTSLQSINYSLVSYRDYSRGLKVYKCASTMADLGFRFYHISEPQVSVL